MQFIPFSPVDIRFASVQKLDELLSSFAGRRTIIVASKGTAGRLEAVTALGGLIKQQGNILISDITPNPSVEDVRRHVNMLRSKDCFDCIIAIGGGSSIDLAKAISALQGLAKTHEASYEEVAQAVSDKLFFDGCEPADIIAVPTTAGTGSEVTRWATVWDFENGRKLSVEHKECYPKLAVMVPELTKSMDKRLTLATGLDALSHAMEGYWAKGRNPLSQALALDSIERIKDALPTVLANPGDTDARKQMCLGSLLAGLSFSMTKTTACHSISYPLTMSYGVEHGLAAALTLSQMMKINISAVPELERIDKLFGGGFEEWLSEVSEGIQKLRLCAFGIGEGDIEDIANGAFTLGRMDNNPAPMELGSVKEVLKNIL